MILAQWSTATTAPAASWQRVATDNRGASARSKAG